MKVFVYIIPTILVAVGVSIFTAQNAQVQVVHSSRENSASIEKKELLKEIEALPPELENIQSELTAMVVEVEEILAESQNNQPLVITNTEVKENISQSIETMYKQAGLNYEAEESRINDAFDSASSDPETLFSK